MPRLFALSLLTISIIALPSQYVHAEVITYRFDGLLNADSLWGSAGSPVIGYFSYKDDLPVYLELTDQTIYGYASRTPQPDVYFQIYFPEHTIYSTHSTRLDIFDDYGQNNPSIITSDIFMIFGQYIYSPTVGIPTSLQFDITLRDTDHSVFDSTSIPAEIPSLSEFEYTYISPMSTMDTDFTSLTKIHNGDLNGDGFVGLDDLDIVLNNWNQDVILGDRLTGDASNNGYVGLDDLDIVLNDWNAGTPPADSVIPEPTTAMLLTATAFSLLNRRRTT